MDVPHRFQVASALAVSAVLMACGGGSTVSTSPTSSPGGPTSAAPTTITPLTTATSTTPGTTPTGARFVVITDMPYLTTGDTALTLDVYVPEGATDAQLVVFFHGAGESKNALQYPQILTALVQRGAVVVAADWGEGDLGATGAEARATVAEVVRRGRCAVAAAVANAATWGARADTVALFGHSGGANLAAVLAFSAAVPASGCAAGPHTWAPEGAVLWEPDPVLMAGPVWDTYGADLPALLDSFTPWRLYGGSAFRGPVRFFVSTDSFTTFRRCDDLATWAGQRDPRGDVLAALQAVDTTDADCLDLGEAITALDSTLARAGVTSTVSHFTDASAHAHLTAGAMRSLVDAVVGVAHRPAG